MIATARRRCRALSCGRAQGEDGVTLILALSFITLLGALVVSLLALTGTGFKVTTVTRSRTDALYAADGGADLALEQIRTTAATSCPPTIAAPPVINGIAPSVSVTCSGGTTTGGGSALLGTYAAIALGSSGVTVGGSAQNGNNLTVKFLGDVSSAGALAPVPGTGNKLSVDGSASLAASSCPYNSTTNPQVTGTCLASQPAPAVSQTSPKVVVPTTAALGTKVSGNCTIMYPGKYTSAPVFSTTKGYYLASGTYYFSSGSVSLNGWIQGGAPGATTPVLANGFTSRCPTSWASDANAKVRQPTYSSTGSGVTIILGGNAQLRVPDNSNNRVELFPRVPASGSPDFGVNQTPGVSIWGQKATTNGVSIPANYTRMTQDAYFTAGKVADVVTHGLTWLPDSVLSIATLPNTDAGGAAQFKGGVVASQLALLPDNVTGGLTAVIAGASAAVVVPRTIIITSTATPGDGGVATTVKVVATYPTTASGYPTIQSWRKV